MAARGHVSPWAAGLSCRCPRCGEGPLYQGYLALRDRCPRCGLDYGFADPGDGPAFFVMWIVGLLVTGGALIVETLYQPPYWVHALLWIPLAMALPLLILRPLKATLIALQYVHGAEESRFD
jgi:uncharacterized protein (DUF983 family)